MYTKQTFEFSQLTLVKQFDDYELKINASRGDRDYTRTGDVDRSTASEGLTSGIMQVLSQMGAVAAYGSEEAYGAAIAAGTADLPPIIPVLFMLPIIVLEFIPPAIGGICCI